MQSLEEEPRGYYSRGYLPHLDLGSKPQFITWRLGDALPLDVLEELEREIARLPDSEQKTERFRRIEAYLDVGHGSCVLRIPSAAIAMQKVLLENHCKTCHVHAWVVMPNHVHAILTPLAGISLGKMVGLIKGRSSFEINRATGGSGQLWQPDYFDRHIRDGEHMLRVRKYIEWNPVKAKICTDPAHWAYSSLSSVAQGKLAQIEELALRAEAREPGAA